MPEFVDVQVHRAILHLVGDGPGRACVLSEVELAFNDRVRSFVCLHILKSLRHDRAWSARFANDQSTVAAASRGIFCCEQFIQKSGEIAQVLGQIVQQDARITTGALLIATFTATTAAEGDLGREFIGILKLTATEGFTTRTQREGDRTKVVFHEVGRVMPSTKEDLHKCAFIPRRHDGAEDPGYDLIVVDWQRKGDPEPAEFFLTRFLDAERAGDPKQLTRLLNKQARSAIIEAHRKNLIDDNTRNDVLSHLHAALRSNVVNIPHFIENLPVSPEAKQLFREKLAALPDREFAPDQEVSIELTRKVHYRGDSGLVVAIDAASRDEMIEEAEDQNAELGRHHKITIRTKMWLAE